MSRQKENNLEEVLKSVHCLKNIIYKIKTNAGSDIFNINYKGKVV